MPTSIEETAKWLENASPLGYKTYKPIYGPDKTKPHENRVKLLSWPPEGSPAPLAKKVMEHFGLGEKGMNRAICPKTYGYKNPCVICNFIESATKSGDASLTKRATDVISKERYLQLLINWDTFEKGEDNNQVVEIYDCPPKVHRNIMQAMATQKHDFTAFSDAALVSLIGYSQGVGPKAIEFSICIENMAPKKVSIDIEHWRHLVPDLEDASRVLSPAKLQALLEGDGDSGAEEPEKEKPAEEDNVPMHHSTDKPGTVDPNWSVSKTAKEPEKPQETPANANKPAPAETGEKKMSPLEKIIADAKAKQLAKAAAVK
jgi:hypothetical protein